MATSITTDLRLSSSHFQHLLNSIPQQYVRDKDAVETTDLPQKAVISTTGSNNQTLQEKLHSKLELLKAKRSKADEDAEKLKLKRKLNKAKKKLKQKNKKAQKRDEATENTAKSEKPENSTSALPSKIFNKEGNVLFSKLEITDSVSGKKKLKLGLPTGKNYKMMLQKVEKQKEKLHKLEETDKEAAKAAKEKVLWKTVIAKAEGVKVKDNEAYLKLALKKKDKLKAKRKEVWNTRQKDLQNKMHKQQAKRKENIDKKKKARSDKKIKRAQKRGRVVF